MDTLKSISHFHRGLVQKEYSVTEVTTHYLDAIKKDNNTINAFLAVHEQEALHSAHVCDKALAEGKTPEGLFGVCMAIKDNINIQGKPTTCASKMLENYVASYDAGVIQNLKKSGALFVGKTNLDEFAMGSSTEFSTKGVTKNPCDITKVAGGSSGGSAAAVAAGFSMGALGSDTGGSIRLPASFCGVVGLKPTYGAVSRYGVVALASSLDQVGPFANTVEDVASIFKALSQYDAHDATMNKTDYTSVDVPLSDETLVKKVLGVPREYFVKGLESEVQKEIDETIERFKKQGFSIKEVSLPHTEHAVSCYYIIMPAEASSNLARFDSLRYAGNKQSDFQKTLHDTYTYARKEGFGEEVQRRILLGAFVLSSGYYDAYYAQAQKVRRLILQDFEEAFKTVDVLLTPTTPTRAFGIGEKIDDPLSMYLSDIMTIPVNLAGLPALVLPTRTYAKNELPTGFQLIGKHNDERTLLSLGQYYQNTIIA